MHVSIRLTMSKSNLTKLSLKSVARMFAVFGGIFVFVAVVLPMMRGRGEKAPQKPWEGAEGLEWEVPSPAPHHTFETAEA